MAFLPSKLIPLERDILRVYVCPCQPSAIEEVRHDESVTRGVVELGGVSQPFDALHGRTVIDVAVDQGDGAEHQKIKWSSEISSCKFEFAPAVFMAALERAREQRGSEDASQTHDSYGGVKNGKARRQVLLTVALLTMALLTIGKLAVKFSTSAAKIGKTRHYRNAEFEVGYTYYGST